MFRIASITKQMTTAAVLQQAEAGKVDLDAPVTTYLPDLSLRPPWRAADLAVRHLLTHNSALADSYAIAGPQAPGALLEWTRNLAGWTVFANPGSIYNYSNPGYSVAGALVEQVSGVGPTAGYGLGVIVDTYRGTEIRSHDGALPGWRGTLVLWAPEHDLAVAVLHNSDTSIGAAGYCVLRQFLTLPRPWPLPDNRTDPAGWGRYAGTCAMVDSAGPAWTADVSYDLGKLTYNEPSIDGSNPAVPLLQQYLDNLLVQGTITSNDFLPARDVPGSVKWLRRRYAVGLRAGRLTVAPGACSPLTIEAGIDLAPLTVRVYGLSPSTPVQFAAVAAQQDDPDDPASARFKQDVVFDTELGALVVNLRGGDDDLDVFVLRDANGDGAFTYPGEQVAASTTTTANERVYAMGPLPAGHYQIWVHGYAVNGQGSPFDLDYLPVTGDSLTVADVPPALSAGQSATLRVCAAPRRPDPQSRTGLIHVDFGYAPRALIVPVSSPAPAALCLPAVLRDALLSQSTGHGAATGQLPGQAAEGPR